EQNGAVDVNAVLDELGRDADADGSDQAALLEIRVVPAVAAQAGRGGADGSVIVELLLRRLTILVLGGVAEELLQALLGVLAVGPLVRAGGGDEDKLVLPERPGPGILPFPAEFFLRSPQFQWILLVALAAAGSDLVGDDVVDEEPAGGRQLGVRERFRLAGVQPEAARDKQQNESAEEEAALPLQTRLAQQSFEGAIGHRSLMTKDQCPMTNRREAWAIWSLVTGHWSFLR